MSLDDSHVRSRTDNFDNGYVLRATTQINQQLMHMVSV